METTDKTQEKQWKKEDNLKPWPKGVSGNPKGRPKGSVSPTAEIRKRFEADPEYFDEWLSKYLEDEKNRKHVVEMLDGKPQAKVDHTTDGRPIIMPSELAAKNGITYSEEESSVDE